MAWIYRTVEQGLKNVQSSKLDGGSSPGLGLGQKRMNFPGVRLEAGSSFGWVGRDH